MVGHGLKDKKALFSLDLNKLQEQEPGTKPAKGSVPYTVLADAVSFEGKPENFEEIGSQIAFDASSNKLFSQTHGNQGSEYAGRYYIIPYEQSPGSGTLDATSTGYQSPNIQLGSVSYTHLTLPTKA